MRIDEKTLLAMGYEPGMLVDDGGTFAEPTDLTSWCLVEAQRQHEEASAAPNEARTIPAEKTDGE